EKNNGNGTVTTIEGNISNKCMRKTRDASTIAGYGRPKYDPNAKKPTHVANMPKPVEGAINIWDETLKPGDKGGAVKAMQNGLLYLGFKLPKYGADGDYGSETTAAIKAFKKTNPNLNDSANLNPTTARALQAAINEKYLREHPPAKPEPTPETPP